MLSPRTKATKCVNNTQMPVLHDVCGRGVVKNARFTCYASQSTQCRQESRTIAEQQPPPRLAHECMWNVFDGKQKRDSALLGSLTIQPPS